MKLNEFDTAYLVCALWTSADDSIEAERHLDSEYSIYDFDESALEKAKHECLEFRENNVGLFARAETVWEGSEEAFYSKMGHNFWLSRNGHGAGYFDEIPNDPVWDLLQEQARGCGEIDAYVGDDGKLYLT
jgi:hypothetical protein